MMVPGSRRPRGFTLVELMVVLLIIALVSAATLPVVLPALAHRQVSESARTLQAAIEGARDAAIRANAPRGIRLMPDPTMAGSTTTANVILASNRIVPIEPAPDYSEGLVNVFGPGSAHPDSVLYPNGGGDPYPPQVLRLEAANYDRQGLPVSPPNWYWNVRVGDRIRIGQAGRLYTVVGPLTVFPPAANPELFVNIGAPDARSPIVRTFATVNGNKQERVEFLYLVNGQDDDADGYVDEGWDGVDNDNANGVDDLGEWNEQEAWVGPESSGGLSGQPYTIKRRPVPTQGARVIEMPSNVVIDLTTWDSTQERSRLPVDPNSLMVDVMISPNGQVIPTTLYSSPSSAPVLPFYHFWLAERTDVFDPLPAAKGTVNLLPVPQGTPVPKKATAPDRFLKGERRLVTLSTRTGMVVTNEVETFSQADINMPYYEAQSGTREAR